MFKFFRLQGDSACYQSYKTRRKNNTAVQKLYEMNKELEQNFEITNALWGRKNSKKAEMKLNIECKLQMKKLEMELETQKTLKAIAAKNEEKVAILNRRNKELQQERDTNNLLLMDVDLLKCQIKAAKQQKQMLKKCNTELEKEVVSLKEKVSYQTKLHYSYRETDDSIKKLQRINEHLMQEISDLKERLEPSTSAKPGMQHVKKKDRERLVSRLSSLVHKVNALKKEFDSFKPDIEKYQQVFQSQKAGKSENGIPPSGDRRSRGKILKEEVEDVSSDQDSPEGERLPPGRQSQSPEDFSESDYETSDGELEETMRRPEPKVEDSISEDTDYDDDFEEPVETFHKKQNSAGPSRGSERHLESEAEDSTSEDLGCEGDFEESFKTFHRRSNSAGPSRMSARHPDPNAKGSSPEQTDYEDCAEDIEEQSRRSTLSTKNEKHPKMKYATHPVSRRSARDAGPTQGRRSGGTSAQMNSGAGGGRHTFGRPLYSLAAALFGAVGYTFLERKPPIFSSQYEVCSDT